MSLNDILKILNLKTIKNDKIIKSIKTDSRKIKKGDLFIALKGKNIDGNKYVSDAIKKGAIGCIVDSNLNIDRCYKVNDTYEALYLIANYIRNMYNIPLIAITGSNGKTTTKELIVHILKEKYKILYNKENKNNIVGVSDTLFRLNKKHDLIVLEFGSNHMGEIAKLSCMSNPTIALITNIGSSHLEYFKNKKNIFKEKYSVVDGMRNVNLIVNGDDKYLSKIKCTKCGCGKSNDLIAYVIEESISRVKFKIFLDKEYEVEFNNPGRQFVIDILLAIRVCLNYIDIDTILSRIKTFKSVLKRMSLVNCRNNNIIINDCYNASYESIKEGLNYLKNIKSSKLVILGDVLELGRKSKKIHKKINKLINKKDSILTVGKYTKYIKGKHFSNVDSLITYLKENEVSNKYIYIKGSRRIGLDKVFEFLS